MSFGCPITPPRKLPPPHCPAYGGTPAVINGPSAPLFPIFSNQVPQVVSVVEGVVLASPPVFPTASNPPKTSANWVPFKITSVPAPFVPLLLYVNTLLYLFPCLGINIPVLLATFAPPPVPCADK